MSQDQVRSALNAMLTFFGMDEDEWNKHIFEQARRALAAQPAAEPVAWMWRTSAAFPKDVAFTTDRDMADSARENGMQVMPLYAAQPARAGGDAPAVPDRIIQAITAYGDARADQDAVALATTFPAVIRMLRAEFAALAAAPQPAAAVADALQTDVLNLLAMLEEGEYAERWAKSELGKRLEDAVTELHNDIHEAADEVEQPAASTVPATEITDAYIDRIRCHTNVPQDSGSEVLRWTKADARTFARNVLAWAAPAAVEREAQPAPSKPRLSDAVIRDWMDRHDLGRVTGDDISHGREIAEDAASLHLIDGIGSSKEGGDVA